MGSGLNHQKKTLSWTGTNTQKQCDACGSDGYACIVKSHNTLIITIVYSSLFLVHPIASRSIVEISICAQIKQRFVRL